MFERFTDGARQVIVTGEDEARMLRHHYIGTEHILLGLLSVDDGFAAWVLDSFQVTVETARAQIVRIVGEGAGEIPTARIPFTPRAKKVLELSLREALSLNDDYIGTEHLLFGLLREGSGAGMAVLKALNVSADSVRMEMMRKRTGPPKDTDERPSSEKRGRRALEAAVAYVTAAKELAIANQDPHQASQIAEIETQLKALLHPHG